MLIKSYQHTLKRYGFWVKKLCHMGTNPLKSYVIWVQKLCHMGTIAPYEKQALRIGKNITVRIRYDFPQRIVDNYHEEAV